MHLVEDDFAEDRVIETRTVARTPGVQTQFATLTVPPIKLLRMGFEPMDPPSGHPLHTGRFKPLSQRTISTRLENRTLSYGFGDRLAAIAYLVCVSIRQ